MEKWTVKEWNRNENQNNHLKNTGNNEIISSFYKLWNNDLIWLESTQYPDTKFMWLSDFGDAVSKVVTGKKKNININNNNNNNEKGKLN